MATSRKSQGKIIVTDGHSVAKPKPRCLHLHLEIVALAARPAFI